MPTLDSYAPETWRPNQRAYAQAILDAVRQPAEKRIGLEGPCGCGKSIGYLRALLAEECPASVVLSTTRQHLAQIEATLATHWPNGDWAILRGRSFYGCCDSPSTSRKVDDQDPELEAEHVGGACPLGERCRYRAAVLACGDAKVVVQCTIGHLYRREFWRAQDPSTAKDAALAQARLAIVEREVVVLDEAHEYVKVRREFETTKLALYARTWLTAGTQRALDAARTQRGGYRASYIVLSDPRHAQLAAAVGADLQATLAKINAQIDAEGNEARAKRLLVQKKKLETRLQVLGHVGTDSKVVSVQWSSFGGGDFADLVSEPQRAFTADRLARVEVFTSATLAPVARLLNIPQENVTIYPEIFDWAGSVRPMPLPEPDPSDRRNTPIDAAQLAALATQPNRPPMIVLAFSRAHATQMTAQIRGLPGVYIQGEDSEVSLGELVERFKADIASGTPWRTLRPVLVTYGGWVGTDVPGTKWLVLGSVPKSPLTAAAEGRALLARTSPWNDYERAAMDRLQLAQGLGRALRTPQDRAVVIWVNNQAARDAGLDPRTGRMRAA
jgi:Rad3-related DNA helicase